MDLTKLFTKLYDSWAFTFEGLAFDDFDVLIGQINDSLKEYGIPAIPSNQFYTFSGSQMNNFYHLTGQNAYPSDLTFVAFTFENLKPMEVNKLAMAKLKFGARWFTDIVDNNTRRESQK